WTHLFEVVDLETLEQLSLCHNDRGHRADFFVEKVVVTERSEDKSHISNVFLCGPWLDLHNDCCHTETMLRMIGGSMDSDCEDKRGLKDGHHREDSGTLAFTSGAESEFHISTGQVCRVTKIRLECDNSGSKPDWRLDYDSSDKLMYFVDRWLALDKVDDGDVGLRDLTGAISKSRFPWQPRQTDIFIVEVVSGGKNKKNEVTFGSPNQDQESIMEKHQRKGNSRQKRPKDVFSKKGIPPEDYARHAGGHCSERCIMGDYGVVGYPGLECAVDRQFFMVIEKNCFILWISVSHCGFLLSLVDFHFMLLF
ncbi:hypothetical protein MAR_012550, partial [Mya arenaria]